MPREVEVKFPVPDPDALRRLLRDAGFHEQTPRTFERNVLYDTPDRRLRAQTAILRIRRYGQRWILTWKSLPQDHDPGARHKHREEIESEVQDGDALGQIFSGLGFTPSFVYEKYRTEFADSTGHCVLDETPIGVYAELEGPPDWIDATGRRLHIDPARFITLSYGRLFEAWRRETASPAQNLTFDEIQPTANAPR